MYAIRCRACGTTFTGDTALEGAYAHQGEDVGCTKGFEMTDVSFALIDSEGCIYGPETGRYFVYDDVACATVTKRPDHDEWSVWTELGPDADGDFYYVSDHEGYTLTAEEFGPFNDDEVLNAEQIKAFRE